MFTWHRGEFTPVPSHGSIFAYTIPPQNAMPARVTPAWVHPSSCTGARISLRYEISELYHVNAKLPPISVWSRSTGRMERVGTGSACVMFAILNHTCILSPWSVLSNNEIWTQSSCKRDSKSKSYPGMKLAPVWVFSCNHPLILNILFVIDCGETSFFFFFYYEKTFRGNFFWGGRTWRCRRHHDDTNICELYYLQQRDW